MTQPPQSGPWGAQPPQQPGNWQGYPGGQHGPGPQGQWNPLQQWPNPAPAPQKKGPLKWVLGAIALIAVIAVTAVVAVSCAGGNGSNNGNGGGTPSPGSKSDIASANDTGPVSVITEDPSCAPWGPINDTVANIEKNGWDKRDPSISSTAWSPEMQTLYQTVGTAIRNAADQTVPLIKLTTHRVMRELFQQYVAYSRAFADRIPTYTIADNNLIVAGATLGSVISGICQSITFGSAAARGPLVPSAKEPQNTPMLGEIDKPTRFIEEHNETCTEWKEAVDQLTADPAFAAWIKEDPNLPASSWPPQYLAENDAVKPVLGRFADTYERLGRQSSNAVMEDFGVLAAQYGRAYITALPTYTQADQYLYTVFRKTPGAVSAACEAAGAN
ncbi:hypothetical protein [Mycobacterium sp. SMC-13]|uniref:hypothetical protein n=1 Tax=Mycobacterium sp. SMC-13 TaxID=3381626 RepID=UPI003876AC6E